MKRHSILTIDDDQHYLCSLIKLLQAADYDVASAATADEGRQLVQLFSETLY